MKIRVYFSNALLFIGIIFIAYACILFAKNQATEQNAAQYSQNVIQKLESELLIVPNDEISLQNEPLEQVEAIQQVTIDDEQYIGILKIPCLELELPIQSEWSYEKLQNTPCVYQDEPFSIAGHNYNAHFGKLSDIKIGDQVIFQTVNATDVYSVVEISKVDQSEIEALQDENYDLTLFTCDYYNESNRILIRLKYVV